MHSPIRLALIAILGCGFAAGSTRAQQRSSPAEDLGAPGPEHKKLDALAGDWDVTLKIPMKPDRQMEGRATCVARWVLDGRFLRLEYSSTFMDKPLTVVRYLGFDRHKNKFVEIHFESTHTDVMRGEGDLSADGKTITSHGTHVDMATDQAVEVRTETTVVDHDTFLLKMTYGDGKGNDAKSITLSHHRRKSKE